ncbi:MAG: sugar phosphate isomerase/epimerase [Methanobacterium sp.]
MKVGFSTLALFLNSFEDWLKRAETDGFQLIEILCEGPQWPRNLLLHDKSEFEVFQSYEIDVFIHSPTIDLNPASLNQGIRDETLNQLKETIDLAVEIGANAITTHPGLIHRYETRVKDIGRQYSIETLTSANEYGNERGIIFSVENMPNKYAYFCNNAEEHALITRECGSCATIDLGHANTSGDIKPFLDMKNICYYHLSDNNGDKDQHLILGEGNLDLELLNGIDKVILELDEYQNVLNSRKILRSCVNSV